MDPKEKQHRAIMKNIARKAMLEGGLKPSFSTEVLAELELITAPAAENDGKVRDLRHLLWASIDNEDSLDLDQLTTARKEGGDNIKVWVAVADVDSLVNKGSAIDEHASSNTTSVYTAAEIFPMIPEKLSTNFTSFNLNEDRLALVVEMEFDAGGDLQASNVYRALVTNHAKLAYNPVADWLEGRESAPDSLSAVDGLEANLRLQDKIAQRMKKLRHDLGALTLETVEARPVFDGDQIRSVAFEEKSRATAIIEDFMIAANGVTARFLSAKKFPSIRRVVSTPKRWDRIMEIAHNHGVTLPATPDSKALEEFLVKGKAADPLRFPDLSLAIIKLLGAGEYVIEQPGEQSLGHFGLAVKDYSHSTAPNRRYPDLLTQRLLKAAIDGKPVPYPLEELEFLAVHCTAMEDAANKIERRVAKSAAALLLESKIGEQFDAIVTGASTKGTWVRLLTLPVDGKVTQGFEGIDVGDQVRVQLTHVDVEKGFIDFRKVSRLQPI